MTDMEYGQTAVRTAVPQDGVPTAHPIPQAAEYRTETRDDVMQDGRDGTEQDGMLSRFRAWRTARARTAEEKAAAERDERARRSTERDAQRASLQQAASRTATEKRAQKRGTAAEDSADELIAPIPMWMKRAKVWMKRLFGTLPEYAPLVISGVFTFRAATDDPVNMWPAMALFATIALEGGLWRLGRLLNQHLLEGDGTLGLRISIALWIGIISGFIFWHADHEARAIGLENAWSGDQWGWVPAAVSAAFCLLGVRMTTHQARFEHRQKLRAENRMDAAMAKFSFASRLWTPIESLRATRHSVRFRIMDPIAAVEDLRLYRASGKPPIWPVPEGFEYVGNGQYRPVEVPTRPAIHVPSTTGTAQDSPTTQILSRPAARPASGGTARQIGTVPQDGGPVRDERDEAAVGTDAEAPVPSRGPTPLSRTGGASGTGTADEILKYADQIMIVTEWCEKRGMSSVPRVDDVIAAIHEYRQSTDGGSFNSRSVAASVRKQLIALREEPSLEDALKLARKLAE